MEMVFSPEKSRIIYTVGGRAFIGDVAVPLALVNSSQQCLSLRKTRWFEGERILRFSRKGDSRYER